MDKHNSHMVHPATILVRLKESTVQRIGLGTMYAYDYDGQEKYVMLPYVKVHVEWLNKEDLFNELSKFNPEQISSWEVSGPGNALTLLIL